MKRLFTKLFVFTLLFVAIDFAIGKSFSILVVKTKGGDTGKNNEIVERTIASVILFGSSRCDHHYDPRIIEDSLHETCYNAGRDGNGILLMYPYYKLLSSRYQPRLIIYDLSRFDVEEDDHSKYLEWLRQFYGHPAIDSMVWAINPNEKYKMLCQAYRFNGKGLQIISDAIHPIQQDILGYKPLTGSLSYEPEKGTTSISTPKQIDKFKEKYLIRLMKHCKKNGTKLIFIVSPTYGHEKRSEYYAALSKLCHDNKVPFLYYQNDKRLIHNRNYFRDPVHLNQMGAEVYTKMVVSEVKKLKAY